MTGDAMTAFDRIGEALKASGVSLEDLLASGCEFRVEVVRERYGLDEGAPESAQQETTVNP